MLINNHKLSTSPDTKNNQSSTKQAATSNNVTQGSIDKQNTINSSNSRKVHIQAVPSRIKSPPFSTDSSNKQTWSQVVKIVQNANLQESQNVKWQENNRKRAYKNQLDQQVQYINNKYILEKGQKERQRTQIQEQVRHELIYRNQNKIKKIKTQQKYRAENLQIIQGQSFNNRKHHKQQDKQKYIQNPFVSLVDQQDLRMKETRNNFLLQNKLNDIQIAIHQQKKKQQNISNKKQRQQYQNFVQNQFRKHDQQRQKFKNRYLNIKKWQGPSKSRSNSPSPESINQDYNTLQSQNSKNEQRMQKKYLNFLDQQVQQKKIRNYQQKQFLDNRSSQINRHVEVPDSSPAYLGRLAISNDRKKQLEILDYNLYNQNFYNGKIKRKDSKNGGKYRNLYAGNLNANSKSNNRPQASLEITNDIGNRKYAGPGLYRSVQISPRVQYNNISNSLNTQQVDQSYDKNQHKQRRAQSNMKLLPSITRQQNPIYSQFNQYKNRLQSNFIHNSNNLNKERQKIFYKDEVLFENNNYNKNNSTKVVNMSQSNIPINLGRNSVGTALAGSINILTNNVSDKKQKQKRAYQKYDFITGSSKIMYV